jgi:hypothetical protein
MQPESVLYVISMRQDFEDEEDLYGEFLDKSDEAVLWPGMLVYKNIWGKTDDRSEDLVESAYLLGESEDLSMANGKIQGREAFSSEYAEESDSSPDIEIGMALGSMYRDICEGKRSATS